MGSLILLIIIVLLFLWGLKEFFQMKLGVGPEGSPKQVANELVALCKDIDGSGTFLDVGSGWGTVLIPMAKALPDWTFFGVEKSPTPWLVSQFRTVKGNAGNINLFLGDAEKFRYRGYDIIYLNLSKKLLNELTPVLMRNIDRGSLVVTYRNQINGTEPFNNIVLKDARGMERQVYLYAKTAAERRPQSEQPLPPEPEAFVKQPEESPAEQPAEAAQPTAAEQPQPQAQGGETHIPEPATATELELEEKPVDEAMVAPEAPTEPAPEK